MLFDGFVCACCGKGIYDLEVAEIIDREADKRYLICFDCADRYTSETALIRIRERIKTGSSLLPSEG